MLRTLMTVAVIGGSLAISGCNTVRGIGEDLKSVADCTEAMMKRGEC